MNCYRIKRWHQEFNVDAERVRWLYDDPQDYVRNMREGYNMLRRKNHHIDCLLFQFREEIPFSYAFYCAAPGTACRFLTYDLERIDELFQ